MAIFASAAPRPDAQASAADEKMSAGLRAAYTEAIASGAGIDLAGVCDGTRTGDRIGVQGADSLLVMLRGSAQGQPASDNGPGHKERNLNAVEQVLGRCRGNENTIAGLTVTQCHSRARFVVLSAPGTQRGDEVSVGQLDTLIADPAVSHVEADCRYTFTGSTTRAAASGCPKKFPCRTGSPDCSQRASCTIEAPPALQRWTDGKLWGPESIGALNVYDELPGMSDAGLLIAVLDSGVFYEDSVFAGRIWENAAESAGVEGVDDDDNGCVDDLHGCAFQDGGDCDHTSESVEFNCDPVDITGHGSAVAEIIASLGPGKILPVRLGNFSSGFSKSNYVAAIDYVDSFARKNPGLRIIVNVSQTIALRNASAAIGNAIANSPSLFVVSVGNYDTIEYPAAYGHDNMIQVSAIGPHACDEPPALTSFIFDDEVDLVAPGTEICTSFDCPDEASECLTQGTSLAAPHVTAAAAMYMHENPSANAQQTRAALIEQAGALKSVDISFLAKSPRRCACDLR